MRLRRFLQIILIILVALAIGVGLTSINHPIILKWLTGSARHHGRPIHATIYTNGEVNDQLKVFYTDEADSYLITFTESGVSTIFNLSLNRNWIGRPVETSNDGYDFIAGHLFQSETGDQFIPVEDEITGRTFDPQLISTDGQIRFNMPPNKFSFDSVRIELH
jgi:hypothetical protein